MIDPDSSIIKFVHFIVAIISLKRSAIAFPCQNKIFIFTQITLMPPPLQSKRNTERRSHLLTPSKAQERHFFGDSISRLIYLEGISQERLLVTGAAGFNHRPSLNRVCINITIVPMAPGHASDCNQLQHNRKHCPTIHAMNFLRTPGSREPLANPFLCQIYDQATMHFSHPSVEAQSKKMDHSRSSLFLPNSSLCQARPVPFCRLRLYL